MVETVNPDVFLTTRVTVEDLPPLYKKICLELVRLGKIKVTDDPATEKNDLIWEVS